MNILSRVRLVSPFLVLVFLLFAFTPADNYRYVPNSSFGTGERIEYRVHYGFINAAEAKVEVNKTISYVNNRPCYRVNVTGRTVGAFDLVSRVRDQWRSYIDTSAILPHMFYRDIKENSYRKEETVLFNHKANTAQATLKDEKKTFKVPDNVHDIISGYYFLRTVNFNRVGEGDIVEVPTFFDGEIYKLRVRYVGKDVLKTKFGKIKVMKLMPLIPDNKFFKGENALQIWVSDDANKVPVKAKVDLVIGALEMDLKAYKGLRAEPNWF